MKISQDQLKTMLQSPDFKGQDPSQVVKSIISQGNTIEGLNLSQNDVPTSEPTPAQGASNQETSLAKNIGSLISPIKLGEGFFKGAAETFTGLHDLASKGVQAIGIPLAPNEQLQQVQQWSTKPGATWGEQLGKTAETIGELATPEGATEGLIGGIGSKSGRLLARAGLGATTFGGQTAAKSGDITKAPGAAITGAVLPVVGSAAGAAFRGITGNLAENVGKAIGVTGKQTLESAQQVIPKATRALQTIADISKDIVVKDADGIEKTFEPTKATFGETIQAMQQAKKQIYQQYSDLASKAGDAGAKFSSGDFWNIRQSLLDMAKDSVPAVKNKVSSLISNLEDNFGTKTKQGIVFNPVDLGRMQKYIESINTDVNPLSDKAGAEVSGAISKSIRDIMDKKITSSTGEGYQILRNQYSDLKSIENGVINQFKKSLRGTGSGVANWVEGFGTLDTLVGIITKSPAETVMGIGKTGLGALMKKLRSPETNLQRAFKIIQEGEQGSQSGIGKFLTGEK